jgi:hypothetical protein
MRYAMRRDMNDGAVADAVKAAGFDVWDFARAGHSIPDKLAVKPLPCGKPFVCWLEIKHANGKLSDKQAAFRAVWEPRGEWIEARDPEATVRQLRELYQLAIRPEYAL